MGSTTSPENSSGAYRNSLQIQRDDFVYHTSMPGKREAPRRISPATVSPQIASLSLPMIALARFGGLVRSGIRFRGRFEAAKKSVGPCAFEWYPYDSFPNLFYIQHLLKWACLSFRDLAASDPVLDIGAADGALSFFWESLGYRVDAFDFSGCNINRLQGLRALASHFKSTICIHDVNLDGRFDLPRQYGVAFFLGTLYHLKNPFYVLEAIARHARYCFLSTRVARLSADRRARLDTLPVAYLLEPAECNSDVTNYFVFSPAGLIVLVKRAGWIVRAGVTSGACDSDPVSPQADERMFLLLESTATNPESLFLPSTPVAKSCV
jgi:SAM-dependent methyltransferase